MPDGVKLPGGPVVVIGGGWSGCAAAVTLARLGHRVVLHEAAATLGGRARRVTRDGLPIDNGQHLLLGAYVQTRNLVEAVHGADAHALLARQPLVLASAGAADPWSLRVRRLRAPLGLLVGLLAARGLTLSERLGVVGWFAHQRRHGFRRPAGETVEQWLADVPARVADRLWKPLCVAALNTPPERACAQTFANVIEAALAGPDGASDMLVPRTDLSALFPDAAASFVARAGGTVHTGSAASIAAFDDTGVVLGDGARAGAAIVAVGPHQLAGALAPLTCDPRVAPTLAAVGSMRHEPIATAWLGYASATALPAPMLQLDDTPGQWLFERSDVLARASADASRPALAQLLAVVVSAAPPDARGDAFAQACDAQIRRALPRLPPLAWSQAIVERRATFACEPSRPRIEARLSSRVVLAGDYLDEALPATIEAAVRGGVAAAFAVDQALAPVG